MKDSVARFDVKKSIKDCDDRLNDYEICTTDDRILSLIRKVLVAGLVPPQAESKKDTIEIDRRLAEEWIESGIGTDRLYDAISKALSKGRT